MPKTIISQQVCPKCNGLGWGNPAEGECTKDVCRTCHGYKEVILIAGAGPLSIKSYSYKTDDDQAEEMVSKKDHLHIVINLQNCNRDIETEKAEMEREKKQTENILERLQQENRELRGQIIKLSNECRANYFEDVGRVKTENENLKKENRQLREWNEQLRQVVGSVQKFRGGYRSLSAALDKYRTWQEQQVMPQ